MERLVPHEQGEGDVYGEKKSRMSSQSRDIPVPYLQYIAEATERQPSSSQRALEIFVHVGVYGLVRSMVLLDTGMDPNMIHPRCVEKMCARVDTYDGPCVQGFNGIKSRFKPPGKVTLQWHFRNGPRVFKEPFIIAPDDAPFDIALGFDFCDHNDILRLNQSAFVVQFEKVSKDEQIQIEARAAAERETNRKLIAEEKEARRCQRIAARTRHTFARVEDNFTDVLPIAPIVNPLPGSEKEKSHDIKQIERVEVEENQSRSIRNPPINAPSAVDLETMNKLTNEKQKSLASESNDGSSLLSSPKRSTTSGSWDDFEPRMELLELCEPRIESLGCALDEKNMYETPRTDMTSPRISWQSAIKRSLENGYTYLTLTLRSQPPKFLVSRLWHRSNSSYPRTILPVIQDVESHLELQRNESNGPRILYTKLLSLAKSINFYQTWQQVRLYKPSFPECLGASEKCAVFRRFSKVQAQLLLEKEEELADLERQLADLEKELDWLDSQRRTNERDPLIDDYQFSRSRRKIMADLEEKFCEYTKLLAAAQQMTALDRPTYYELNDVEGPSNGRDLVLKKNDLVILRPRGQGLWLENSVRYFTWLYRSLVIVVSRKFGSKQKDETSTVYYTRARTERLVVTIMMTVATIIFVVPIIILRILVKSQSYGNRHEVAILCVFIVFAFAFSAFLSLFTRSKRHEILAATAAYCAVLMVFFGNMERKRN